MDRGAWPAAVHGVVEWTQRSDSTITNMQQRPSLPINQLSLSKVRSLSKNQSLLVLGRVCAFISPSYSYTEQVTGVQV